MLNYIKNLTKELGNAFLDFTKSRNFARVDENNIRKIVRDIENKGFCVVDDFYSKALCDKISEEIDNMILSHRSKVWVDQFESDHRLYAADRKSGLVSNFFNDKFLRKVSSGYMGSDLVGFTLAARLTAKPENLGSGGGWHRDALKRQIKSIIYLTDVDIKSGPFEYFEGSHRHGEKLQNFILNELKHHTRYSENEISKFKERGLETITAKAGTLILVDTSGIHRGRPIDEGSRYALTNYFWTDSIPEHISKLFI